MYIGKAIAVGTSIASILPAPIGMAAVGVSAAAYAATGDYKQAAIMAATIALAAVRVGATVVAYKAAKAANVFKKFNEASKIKSYSKYDGINSKLFGSGGMLKGFCGSLNKGKLNDSFLLRAGWRN